MGTITGTVRDTQNVAIQNAIVTAKHRIPAFGLNGGAAVANVRQFTANASGFVTMDNMAPGAWDVYFAIVENDNTTQTILNQASLNVTVADQTLENAISQTVGNVTPSVLQSAIAAKDAAEAAALALEVVSYRRQGQFFGTAGQADYSLGIPVIYSDQVILTRNGQTLTPETDYTLAVISDVAHIRLTPAPDFSGDVFLYTVVDRSITPPASAEWFASRGALVTHIAGVGAVAGKLYFAEGLSYWGVAAADDIADLPGLVPAESVYPEHFGAVDGTDDQVQIKAAWTYVQSIGGGEVHLMAKTYQLGLDGTLDLANGDRNGHLKLEGANFVMLRGKGREATVLRANTTEVAHVVKFGSRENIDPADNIPAFGGLSGVTVQGNRTTAVSRGINFEGGAGILASAQAGDVGTIVLDDFEVIDAWGYGVGAQRAAWKDSRITNFKVIRPGDDGLDLKYDQNANGESNNYAAHGFIKDHSMRGADLTGSNKAGLDLREGWSGYDIEIETSNPGAVGFRFQNAEDGDEDQPNRTQISNIRAKVAQGTVRGQQSFAIQISGNRCQASSLYGEGGEYAFWISGGPGHKITNMTARGHAVTGVYLNSTSPNDLSDCQFIGVEVDESGSGPDIEIATGAEAPFATPSNNQFIGVKAASITIGEGSTNTQITGDPGTVTDNGTLTFINSMARGGNSDTGWARHIDGFQQVWMNNVVDQSIDDGGFVHRDNTTGSTPVSTPPITLPIAFASGSFNTMLQVQSFGDQGSRLNAARFLEATALPLTSTTVAVTVANTRDGASSLTARVDLLCTGFWK